MGPDDSKTYGLRAGGLTVSMKNMTLVSQTHTLPSNSTSIYQIPKPQPISVSNGTVTGGINSTEVLNGQRDPPRPIARPNDNKTQQPPRRQENGADEYLIGVGIADITGPAADINLMGYAKPNQDAGGIHLRQFCRSIVVANCDRGNDSASKQRVLYISIDNGMVSQLLRIQVLQQLALKFGDLYNERNVMITGGFFQYWLYNIPSSGFIPQVLESLINGIIRSVNRAHVSLTRGRIFHNHGDLIGAGINRSPTAYESNPSEERAQYEYDTDTTMSMLKLVDLHDKPLAMISWFPVHGTSMNNSNRLISSDNKGYASILFEQEFNPPGTLPGRGKFVAIFAQANEGDVSPNTLGPRCAISGLPCDAATSTCPINPINRPVRWRRADSGVSERPAVPLLDRLTDSFMRRRGGIGRRDPTSRSSDGDNFNRPTPTNGNSNEKCVAAGPGRDMFESTKIIAYRQYLKARELFLDVISLQPVKGPIKFIHERIDMAQQLVPVYRSAVDVAMNYQPSVMATSILNNAGRLRTCPAALGYSFAAGTIDGSGAFNFQQGDRASTPYWNMVRNLLRRPSSDQIMCHQPKPILVSTGEMDFPYMWHPRLVPTQLIAIGQIVIVGLPGEFTTMAGRRLRDAVQMTLDSREASDINLTTRQETLAEEDTKRNYTTINSSARKKRGNEPKFRVILSGLSNIYTSYVTTIEEYYAQRYEGASTLYGPHTLQAYVNQFKRLARYLDLSDDQLGEKSLNMSSIQAPDLTRNLFSLKAGVFYDGSPSGYKFGQVLTDVNITRVYSCGEQVTVVFVAGNPRSDLRHEDSFLYVEKFIGNDTWLPIASDASWDTKFIWDRTNTLKGESTATIQWDIPTFCSSGIHRILHFGSAKRLLQPVEHYVGQSSPFIVVAQQEEMKDARYLEHLLNDALVDLSRGEHVAHKLDASEQRNA